MGSFIGLCVGLSFVFGCILMGLVAELYHLLWRKKITANSSRGIEHFSFLFCWRKPNSSIHSTSYNQELTNSVRNPRGGEEEEEEEQDLEVGPDLGFKEHCEEGVEQELMRIHNLCGPPRFLFTIKEESREDLESDDGKSRQVEVVDGTPCITPLSSPISKAPNSLEYSYNHHHGINSFSEFITEAELNRLRSSPPPKFKFLKDAEDKLLRKLLKEESDRKMCSKVEESVQKSVIGNPQNPKMGANVREQLHSQASKVLPLASSPT